MAHSDEINLVGRVEMLLRQDPSLVVTADTEDGEPVVKIRTSEVPPQSGKIRIETRKGPLDLDPDDPLVQAQEALERASQGIAELKAI